MPNNYNDWGEFAASLELRQEGFLEDLIEEFTKRLNYFFEEYNKNNDVYCFYLMHEFLIEIRLLYCLLNKNADERYKKIYSEYKIIKEKILKEGGRSNG